MSTDPKLNAMKMLDMIEKIYANKNYHFLTTNCAKVARLVVDAGMSQEMRNVKKASKITRGMFKSPKIETPSSMKDFGLLLKKQLDSLKSHKPIETARYYYNLLCNRAMTSEHQVLIAKSLQFLKLLDGLSSNRRISKKQANKLAKLAYDLTTNPKYHIHQFKKELSATKLTYGTPKDQREGMKSLGQQMIKAAEAFANHKQKSTAVSSLSAFHLLGEKTNKPVDNGSAVVSMARP